MTIPTLNMCRPFSRYRILGQTWYPKRPQQSSLPSNNTFIRRNTGTTRYYFHSQFQDPYDQFRQSLTSETVQSLQSESEATLKRIDGILVAKVLEEMHQSIENQPKTVPESGPTGTWTYSLANGRVYERQLGEKTQVVMPLLPDEDVLSMSLSVDESLVACLVSNGDTSSLRIRHMEHGIDTRIPVTHDFVSIEWGPLQSNNDHCLYVVQADVQGRPNRVSAHIINSELQKTSGNSKLLYQNDDPAVIVDAQRSKGCHYIIIQAMTKTDNEVYLSSDPSTMVLVRPRESGVQYHLDVGDRGDVVVLLSREGKDYSLTETTVDALPMPTESSFQPGTLTEDNYVISDMDLFRDQLVLYERSRDTGCQRVRVKSRDGSPQSNLPIPNDGLPCSQISPGGNLCFSSSELRFFQDSPTMRIPYVYDFESMTLMQQDASNPNTAEHHPIQERYFAISSDSTQVPISVVYVPDESLNSRRGREERPVVLVGYGAYGEAMNLGYDPSWAPLLSRGFVLAFAHTRGGGDLGKEWYHSGRGRNKVNAIDDYQASALSLKERWGGPLIAKAFSAGGVVVGATINRQPELFDGAVFTNAFLDVYATLMNSRLFLTSHEWDEYGNPVEDEEIRRLIESYCPVRNILSRTDNYPATLLIGALKDENVPYWNSAIYADILRSRGGASRVHLFLEDSPHHHFGGRRLQISAIENAFIIQNVQKG